MTRDTGGSAFPIYQEGMNLGDTAGPGMTLRDWFAGQISQGILAGGWADTIPLDDVEHAKQLAGFAYAAADAMIAERSKP